MDFLMRKRIVSAGEAQALGLVHEVVADDELEAATLALARELEAGGRPVIFLDSNPQNCRLAEEAGFPVVFGNALQERTLQRARFEGEHTVVALDDGAILFEVKQGPFRPELAKEPADWSPEEGTAEGVALIERLRARLSGVS